MAEITVSSQHPNPALQSLLHCLDPISLILAQNPDSDQPVQLRHASESFVTERGPRYKAYAELRESRLRARYYAPIQEEPQLIRASTPPRKQVKFQSNANANANAKPNRKGSGSCSVAQSVPDFSAVLRKENRRPPAMATVFEMTPPAKSLSKAKPSAASNSRGSKSASAAGEKRPGIGARKSYASIEDLKGFSLAAANAINGAAARRTVLGYRAF